VASLAEKRAAQLPVCETRGVQSNAVAKPSPAQVRWVVGAGGRSRREGIIRLMNGQTRRRAAALLEVLGLSLAGPLVMWGLRRLIGVSVTNPLNNLTVHTADAELIKASRQMFVLLMFQYAGYFLLIFPINWWYRRRGPACYGLTRAGCSWIALLLAGLGTVALSAWPVMSIALINVICPLGETAPWRQAIFDMSWRRWEFWLFSAVFSWALVPVVEELFFRAYLSAAAGRGLGRWASNHWNRLSFYLRAHPVSNTQRVQRRNDREPPHARDRVRSGVRVDAIADSVDYCPRHCQPSDDAHLAGVLLAGFVIGAMVTWRRGAATFKQIFSTASVAACVALAVLGAGYAIAGARFDSLTYLAAAMVVFAVGLEAMERQRNRLVSEVSTSA
jgi:membrane protease YdiL (CAAX protease family)